MNALSLELTYIGGPTLLLELCGIRLLTDPTFDPVGGVFRAPLYQLRKTQGPAVAVGDLGQIDVILLSHDHHYDNLDTAGRGVLAKAGTVLTTQAGAGRLGGNARGLGNWESLELPTRDNGRLTITGTPSPARACVWRSGARYGLRADMVARAGTRDLYLRRHGLVRRSRRREPAVSHPPRGPLPGRGASPRGGAIAPHDDRRRRAARGGRVSGGYHRAGSLRGLDPLLRVARGHHARLCARRPRAPASLAGSEPEDAPAAGMMIGGADTLLP